MSTEEPVAREHAVVPTTYCKECERELKLVPGEPEGVLVSEVCPHCFPGKETASAPSLPRETGLDPEKKEEVPDA